MLTSTAPQPLRLRNRELEQHIWGAPNAHRFWYRARNHLNGPVIGPVRIMLNYVAIHAARHLPSLTLKRWLFRCLGMRLGRNVTIASGATLDYFFPELIEIGDNSIVGMNAMILTHEFLHDRICKGRVRIGKDSMIATQTTVLAGVTIGDQVTVAAMSLVNKCVPSRCLVAGIPVRIVRQSTKQAA